VLRTLAVAGLTFQLAASLEREKKPTEWVRNQDQRHCCGYLRLATKIAIIIDMISTWAG
jgi:hypothetical protein